jgi:hypothetical protein
MREMNNQNISEKGQEEVWYASHFGLESFVETEECLSFCKRRTTAWYGADHTKDQRGVQSLDVRQVWRELRHDGRVGLVRVCVGV